jgi:hypothetical protein
VKLLEAGEIVAQAGFKSCVRLHAHEQDDVEDNEDCEEYEDQSKKHFRNALFYCTAAAG